MVITAIQINSNNKSNENLEKVLYFLEKAMDTHPDIIVLPEYTNYMGALDKAQSHALGNMSIWHKQLSGFAKKNRTGIIIGLLLAEENNKASSSVLYFDKNGTLKSTYKKLHLFDITLDEDVRISESRYLHAGTKPGLCTIKTETTRRAITCGIAICYDLRFPELFRTLTRQDARIIFLPSAFTAKTGKAHWEVLVRARAIENQVFMIAINQVGNYADGKTSYGKSLIVDPWGRILAQAPCAGENTDEAIISARINLSAQDDIRTKLPCLSHRRTDIFGK